MYICHPHQDVYLSRAHLWQYCAYLFNKVNILSCTLINKTSNWWMLMTHICYTLNKTQLNLNIFQAGWYMFAVIKRYLFWRYMQAHIWTTYTRELPHPIPPSFDAGATVHRFCYASLFPLFEKYLIFHYSGGFVHHDGAVCI